ncbi:Ger(x)C family spore germination protein [Aquibacillus koreensis]|uniref:Ger(X)C family spore germination protein n=1 Tax=Aquibacillus koreensis TaxID=279446 RepID=A0A9X3WKD1_9BACI|nr:Ger(x)C family spore germination protein [Aquibacillus koreensis]MCT2535785.1 Ger(x)C family spore germination protein [Aquibacillus koreensis]MDC3420240.1 Ger(x)C family spore germination protein [Aquibacillus koreensis]
MKKSLLAFICLILLIGCVPMYPIEELGVISIIGVDAIEQGEIETTFNFFKFDPTGKEQSQTTSTKANTVKGAQDRANLESNLKLVNGQLRLAIFGKAIAEKGLITVLDNFTRDPKLSDTMYLAATEQTAKDILMTADKNNSIQAEEYLFELIDNNIKREIIMRSSFREFMHEYNDPGMDPVLPLITTENQKPIIKNIALFQNDRWVATASQQEGFFIKLLSSEFKAGQLELGILKEPFESDIQAKANNNNTEQISVTLSELRSKKKISLESETDLNFRVKVDIETRIMEISEKIQIEGKEQLNEFEKEIEKTISNKLNDLVAKLQEINVDPIGFGNIYDSTVRGKDLTDKEWREKYPSINVSFDVNVSILRHGITE